MADTGEMARPARSGLLRRLLVAATGAALLALPGPGGSATVAHEVRPIIADVEAFDAPIGERGGIKSTAVGCSDARVQPRVRMRIVNPATGWTRTFRWRGDLPGLYFPRVVVGDYDITTTAWCATSKAVRKETVTVREKTYAGTISRAEFRAVRRGMTRAEVTAIVGNGGRDPFGYAGGTSWTYDQMAFWSWSILTYRDGRLVQKMWDVGHD